MKTQTIRDLLWIWGMEVNALQKTGEYGKLGFGTSTMTVEDAIHRTGITNIYVAGHLPLELQPPDANPAGSAQRH